MLLCAGILGRYYTDWHDVDEDLRTIAEYGGRWESGSKAGIAHRDMTPIPTYTVDTVASLKINRAFMILLVLMLYYKKYINYSILRIVITI